MAVSLTGMVRLAEIGSLNKPSIVLVSVLRGSSGHVDQRPSDDPEQQPIDRWVTLSQR